MLRSGVVIGVLCCLLAINVCQADSRYDNMGEQVLEEINLARAQPRLYAEYIRIWSRQFKGNFYRLPGMDALRHTREGVAALQEAIEFLEGQTPLPPLRWSPSLSAAAAKLTGDQQGTGSPGPLTAAAGEKSEPNVPERRFDLQKRPLANEPRLLVMQLIVDDGIPGRGHRKNLFSTRFQSAGVACGPHRLFGTMCIADFAAN